MSVCVWVWEKVRQREEGRLAGTWKIRKGRESIGRDGDGPDYRECDTTGHLVAGLLTKQSNLFCPLLLSLLWLNFTERNLYKKKKKNSLKGIYAYKRTHKLFLQASLHCRTTTLSPPHSDASSHPLPHYIHSFYIYIF